MEEVPITLAGKNKIEAELLHLIRVEREELKVAISEARDLGDLKENAEYHSAKERQSIIEGRIAHLQGIIARSRVIEVSKIKSTKIVFLSALPVPDRAFEGRQQAGYRFEQGGFPDPVGSQEPGHCPADQLCIDMLKERFIPGIPDRHIQYVQNSGHKSTALFLNIT